MSDTYYSGKGGQASSFSQNGNLKLDPDAVTQGQKTGTSVTDIYHTPLFTEPMRNKISKQKEETELEMQRCKGQLFIGREYDTWQVEYSMLSFTPAPDSALRTSYSNERTSLTISIAIGFVVVILTTLGCIKSIKRKLKKSEKDAVNNYNYQ